MRTIGTPGSGTTVGAPVQFGTALRYTCWLPFTTASVLVDDSSGRVVEVDVVTGFLKRIWLARGSVSFAASQSLVVISYGTQMDLFDTGATLIRSITTPLYPWGLRLTLDSSYIHVVDQGASGSLRRFRVSDGAALTPLATVTGTALDDVEECISSVTGTIGNIVMTDNDSELRVVDGVSAVTVWKGGLARGLGFAQAPGLGLIVADFNNNRLALVSSVSILTHPVNTYVITPAAATFTVALTTTSATWGVSYVWTKAGAVVGTNSSSYTYTGDNTDADVGPAHSIVCNVSHALGYAVSTTAVLTVARGVTLAPTSAAPTVGGAAVTFTATPAVGNTVTNYAWTVGGVAVGTNSATYVYTPVDAHTGAAVNVVCTVTASKGTTTSNTAVLGVMVSPRRVPCVVTRSTNQSINELVAVKALSASQESQCRRELPSSPLVPLGPPPA